MTISISKLTRPLASLAAVAALAAAMGGTWTTASAAPSSPMAAVTQPGQTDHPAKKTTRKELTGKVNLNTATEEQLMMLPAVGPAKADRIVAWRKKNGGFK